MKVLITGGAGFIGSHLAEKLLREGHEVYALDDLSSGRLQNIHHLLKEKRFHFMEGSILNQALVESLVSQVELVYHLAAVVGVKNVLKDPLRCIQVNVRGTENVLEAAQRRGCKVLLASSSEVYGKSTALPLKEEGDILLGPTNVRRWAYAEAKALDERLAFGYREKGLMVVVVRYFNAYGPRLDPEGYGSVIARFIGQARRGQPLTIYSDGKQTRCFTYVEDTVRGTILAATVKEAEGQVFNIGSDREISIRELGEKIKELTGSTSPIVHLPYEQVYGEDFEETRRRVPDVRKAEKVLGFRAQVELEEGLRRTIAWFEGRDEDQA